MTDVIVVGAGSAGAAAAARLAQAGARVLLLEAGGPDDHPAIHDPSRVHELMSSEENWDYWTVPQAHADGRRIWWPRGRVLGGSSCLNGMIYVRCAPADYDHWAYLGNPGWSWADVVPVFERMERDALTVTTDYELDPIQGSIIDASREAGVPFNEDYNGASLEGVGVIQLTLKDGERHSTARAYLRPQADNPNLRVVTRAHARRLLLDGTRCTGVEWMSPEGAVERAQADEVIVCGGAIGSPQLLLVSGIGPADHLREVGVEVAHDLPGVGENLHDHLLSPVTYSTTREIGPLRPGHAMQQSHLFWYSRPGLLVPDIQPVHFSVPLYEAGQTGPSDGFTLSAGLIRPVSRGTLRLTGPSVDDPLALDPNILACRADLDALVACVELCREIGRAPALAEEWGATELYPGPEPDLEAYVHATAGSYHHQVGTCKMGTDALAVVDPELRVHGIDGLRVADASIMPVVPTGNTNAPSIMIGERVAELAA